MRKISFKAWRQAALTWHLIYEATKKGEKFASPCGFEDLMITDGSGFVVNQFGYCEESMQEGRVFGKHSSSLDRCFFCPLFMKQCGYDSTKESVRNTFIWLYIYAMRENQKDAAIYYSRRIFQDILWQCPRPFLARLYGINITKIFAEMGK